MFSVNHISEYLATENASQRTKIIRDAKFPKKIEVAAYGQVRKSIQAALSRPDFDQPTLRMLADKMAAKALREAGHARDEALRCERAVLAFMETIQPRNFARMQVSAALNNLALRVQGVKLKVTMDASIMQEAGGVTNVGGIVLLYAFSIDRGSIKPRLVATTSLMLWALEPGQMEPLPKLCMAADLAGGEIVRASPSHARFRSNVNESCREIASRWGSIEPPDDYDGPDWG